MAQIQVIPYVPSPLEELTPYIAKFGGEIAKGLKQRRDNLNDEKVFQTLADPNLTPMERITQSLKLSPDRREAYYSGLRATTEGEKFGFSKEREKRLSHADTLGAYDKRISQINTDIKESGSREDRKRLSELKANLVKEQAINRTRLRGGQEPQFKYLELQDTQPEQSQATQPQQAPEQVQPLQQQAAPLKQKVKFDPNNPKHIARRTQALQRAGSKEEANRVLNEEFE